MAKKQEVVSAGDEVFDLSLTEWCSDRSVVDKRVELLGAFFKSESVAGRGRGSAAGYAERFDAFANRAA